MSDNLPELPGQPDAADTWHPPTQMDVTRYLGAYSRALDEATADSKRLGQEYAEARKAHRLAKAHAYLKTLGQGSIKDREAITALAIADEEFAMEAKEQELKAARERIDTLKTQISTGQSIGAAIRAEMSLAGTTWGAA